MLQKKALDMQNIMMQNLSFQKCEIALSFCKLGHKRSSKVNYIRTIYIIPDHCCLCVSGPGGFFMLSKMAQGGQLSCHKWFPRPYMPGPFKRLQDKQ